MVINRWSAGRSGVAQSGGSRAAGAALSCGNRRPQLAAVQHDTRAGSVPGTAQSNTALRSTGSVELRMGVSKWQTFAAGKGFL